MLRPAEGAHTSAWAMLRILGQETIAIYIPKHHFILENGLLWDFSNVEETLQFRAQKQHAGTLNVPTRTA